MPKSTVPFRPIIINLNVLEDRLAHLISDYERFVLNRFNFHRMKEPLNTSIDALMSSQPR